MSNVSETITHVSDTALLVAGCRALETERPDRLVCDLFAGRLAGERGLAMVRALPHPEVMLFGIAVRTRFIDDLVLDAIATGIGTVVCVGAGLDTRPWRLELPRDLRWIEVDFAAMLDFKEALLKGETPRCRREGLAADINDPAQRERVYSAVGSGPALMITEGLLMYLPAGTVESLARESAQTNGIVDWIADIVTNSFSEAIGGGGSRVVKHVQAEDHLTGEQIVETLHSKGWQTWMHRSYITDLQFASERLKSFAKGAALTARPPAFKADDQAGVFLLRKA